MPKPKKGQKKANALAKLGAKKAEKQEQLDKELEENAQIQQDISNTEGMREETQRKTEQFCTDNQKVLEEKEESRERHQGELKLVDQKEKFHQWDHHFATSQIEVERQKLDQKAEKEHRAMEAELLKQIHSMADAPPNADNQSLFRKLTMQHQRDMLAATEQWEKYMGRLLADKEKDFQQLVDDMNQFSVQHIKEKQQQMDHGLSTLKLNYHHTMSRAHAFMETVELDTQKALTLQRHIDQYKKKDAARTKELTTISLENQQLAQLLSEAEDENVKLRKKLRNHPKYRQTYC